MEEVKKEIFQSDKFKSFRENIEKLKPGEILKVEGVGGSLLAFQASFVFEDSRKQILLIASDEDRSEKLRDDCALLLGEHYVRYFGARPMHQAQMLDVSSSISQIETLKALTTGERFLVIASPNSIVEKLPPRERFTDTIFEIEANRTYNFQKFIDRLDQTGFERKNFVESYGDYAVRGGIIDVFPYVGENPVRFEFWGDAVESIREFDVLSQRSIRELKSASIVPKLTADNTDNAQINTDSLFDYLAKDVIVILDEPEIIKREIEELIRENVENIFTYEEIIKKATAFPIIINSFFNEITHNFQPTRAVKQLTTLNTLDFNSVSQPSFNGSVNLLIDHIAKLENERYKIFLSSDTKEEAERLKELIDEAVTNPEKIEDRKLRNWEATRSAHLTSQICPVFLTETIHSGFISHDSKIAVFTEHEIFGRLKKRGLTKRRRFKGFSHKELKQLKNGDYVVHVDHGIGEFAGLTKIKVGGIEQEVMKVLFLEQDTLYVNLNFVNRVQKYSSQEGHIPKLTKLGAPDWERMKAKAKKRIKDIARELISLYAKRKKENGTAFSPDSHWQKELEASFMYEDTVDQATATLDVKRDMESPSPMDRLICGDVGFGKTEVALRATFKAVMDGKQVAILVPTTILALQHYNTFVDRLQRYTTRVENLTRFKSKKDQNRIIEEMKKGSVDIVIGTHRLLSKDIGFKDLGLLIIDEEHRFGVSAKEKLRQLKASVDTLALTATPIPRTLHFSLIGARDLSLINTPPRNRIPIITEIIPASDGRRTQWHIIREAILKELHRGGQIYFVHDRVQNIDAIAEQVKTHIPEARVHVAHGQMTGHQLEKTMLDFLEKKYDVLVATKIIESGLDIPNVNTIIINRADRFGLAELYQLRGRVGRSNVQAYAYLLVPPISILPKHTLRRLSAIEEFTELGSGFNLAMRDLEIRGAGNLLGAEQSGFIIEMGFEMYERIVRETVDELKQEEFSDVFKAEEPTSHIPHPQSVESIVDADIDALIPDFYIENDAERLDIYRRLYQATSDEELKSMREELKDRFGESPEEVENLIQLVEVRLLASRAGFPKIMIKEQTLAITLPNETNKQFYGEIGDANSPFQRLIKKIANEKRKDIRLKQNEKELTLQFNLEAIKEPGKRINEIKIRIGEIAKLSES
ncbi:MAG: transcription-repair coupling factor [Ignavibacteriales bacterium]|nr:transcription-repair coupling factor [Ignavibacteriales bacterium]